MTEEDIKVILFDAFFHKKQVKVIRRCFGEDEICIGEIYEVARREHPKTKRNTLCFSMVANDKWWITDTLQSLSPWINQISEIEIVQ